MTLHDAFFHLAYGLRDDRIISNTTFYYYAASFPPMPTFDSPTYSCGPPINVSMIISSSWRIQIRNRPGLTRLWDGVDAADLLIERPLVGVGRAVALTYAAAAASGLPWATP